ncbi:acyltransferase [Parasegetibacter sp. NRK P23]|uniref:acyltransferase family protein n=1 Tax=Parasegetibacter sp. NRK P23 TaxID=2942999 RepID=UPI0020447F8E|nr:acyltransferase [Parasegetibacter sp. NRK P23]MCM5527272.1 acyltransferase [Parasegetibacter sp. NRK P23]
MSETITPAAPPVVVTEKKKREFIGYIHNFRGFAIISVVAGHLLMEWPEDSIIHQFIRVFWENGTVLFMFMAGYLFHHLSANFKYKTYLVSKLKFVVLPYLLLSIPILAYRLYSGDIPGYLLAYKPDFMALSGWEKFGFLYVTGGHMQQFWFIPMIVIFYLLAPVFLYINRHPVWYWIILPLMVLSMYIGRDPFSDIPRMFVHFLPCYIFGMFMSYKRADYLLFAQKYWWLITGATLLVLGLNFALFPVANTQLNFLHKMLFCPFFIYWFWKLDKKVPAMLSTLAHLSFGIFFVHYYVLLVLKAVYEKLMKQPIPGNLLYWTIYLVLVLAGSMLVIKAAQKLFGKNSKYLVGC